MSTLSAQCDELRELATKYDELKSGATRVVRISLDTGPVLREAADTIDRLDAENAKLRELCETFGMIANDAVCDYYERDEMLEQANADARELGVVL